MELSRTFCSVSLLTDLVRDCHMHALPVICHEQIRGKLFIYGDLIEITD